MFCIFKAKHRTFFPVLRVVKASLAGGNVEILIFLFHGFFINNWSVIQEKVVT